MQRLNNLSKRSAFHNFRLGELELTVVSDGHIVFDPKQPILAPGISEEEVNKVLENYYLPTEYVDIAMNVLVIQHKEKTVLIDSGAGITMGENSGWLLNNLRIAGIDPSVVTDIILTHAHSDHIGGVLDETGNLSFPNAQVYLTKAEHDFWLADHVNLSKSKLGDKEWFINFSVDIIKRAKDKLGDKLRLVETDATIFDFLKLISAPGHTPGHVAVMISSQGESLFHLGDTSHTHVLLFEHPEWGFEADYDFEQGVQTRIKLMSELADGRQRAFSFHLPFPGLGHVGRHNGAFTWIAETFTGFNAAPFYAA